MAAITIHYNAACGRCRRLARWTRRLDWLRRVRLSTERSPLGPVPMGETVVVGRRGEIWTGIEATRAICRQVPLYWPAALLLAIGPLRRRLDRGSRPACTGERCDV